MKQTILVVDDSPFVYHQLKDMVEDSDYEVIGSAKSGEEGLETVSYTHLRAHET